jgi:hypothetical protein
MGKCSLLKKKRNKKKGTKGKRKDCLPKECKNVFGPREKKKGGE